jgi:hypothetical protein
LRSYAEGYPEACRGGRLSVIANGYDEALFEDLPSPMEPTVGDPLVLLHSGVLYRDGRDPIPFLTALARLKANGSVGAGNLKVVLRASSSKAIYAGELQRLGIADLVDLAPRVSNREALSEQARADGLLLFQGKQYDRQIPAKVYEYLRIGRPVFALVGEEGETAALLRETGGAEQVALDDVDAIEARLAGFIAALRAGRAQRVRPEIAASYSRRAGTASLAGLLDDITTEVPA